MDENQNFLFFFKKNYFYLVRGLYVLCMSLHMSEGALCHVSACEDQRLMLRCLPQPLLPLFFQKFILFLISWICTQVCAHPWLPMPLETRSVGACWSYSHRWLWAAWWGCWDQTLVLWKSSQFSSLRSHLSTPSLSYFWVRVPNWAWSLLFQLCWLS